MRNKITYINETINEHNLSLLCLTETWLKDEDIKLTCGHLTDTHYLLNKPRCGTQKGGGVGMIIHKSLSSVKTIAYEDDVHSFEHLTLSFTYGGKSFKLSVIYRHGQPGTDQDFLLNFQKYLEWFQSLCGFHIIVGDFNYWIDNPELKPYSKDFNDLLMGLNCKNHVKDPTHISGHTLDLIITDVNSEDLPKYITVYPPVPEFSDHSLVLMTADLPVPQRLKKTITFRNFKNADANAVSSFYNDLLTMNFERLTLNELVETYNDTITNAVNKFCPLKEKTVIIDQTAQWFNSSIAHHRRIRRQAERRWRLKKDYESRRAYNDSRNKVVKMIEEAKSVYLKDKIESACGNQRKLWKTLNNLLGKKSSSPLPSDDDDFHLAENFSNYFNEKIVRIRDTFVRSRSTENVNYSVQFSDRSNDINNIFSFQTISLEELKVVINKVKKTHCSLDPVNVSKAYNMFIKPLYPLILEIINRSFQHHVFPEKLKEAVVRPLLKKDNLDKEIIANYRPVSNLSYLSKVLETAAFSQLQIFIDLNNLIPVFQSAYQKYHSTETALCRINNDLNINVCNGRPTLLMLLDLSSAFDTIDQNMLISDLQCLGISQNARSFLLSYLDNRHQRVLINKTLSNNKPLHCGVPQGSILGPVLFVLYTSSLSRLLDAHGVAYHLYADDTQVYIPIIDMGECMNKINLIMSDIRSWMYSRKLKLNENKTDIILINGNNKRSVYDQVALIHIGDVPVEPSLNVKNIGVVFDRSLNYEKQIDDVVRKCNFHIINLYRIRKYLNRDALLTLIHALVTTNIDYCNSLYYDIPNKCLKKLQSILNRAARLIFYLPPRTSTTKYLIQLHWLPIKARIEFKICLLVYKTLNFGKPKYLFDLLVRNSNSSHIALRSTGDPFKLNEPMALNNRAFNYRSFSYCAPRLYNSLPITIKQAKSINTFKTMLKTYLFEKSYDTESKTINNCYKI